MNYISLNEGNQLARSLTKALRQKFPELKLADALEAVAASQGYADWNAFSKKETTASIDALLKPFELAHAHDAADADQRAEDSDCGGYGAESILRGHNGFQLRTPAYPSECDYVRVCDPLGREIAYWSSAEWQQAPEEVMGAVMGALVRGQCWSDKKKPSKKAPHIAQVNFDKVGEIIFGDVCYTLAWRIFTQENLSSHLSAALDNLDETTLSAPALQLATTVDGFEEMRAVTVEELRELRWDLEQRCFVTPSGEAFKVFYALDFAETLPV